MAKAKTKLENMNIEEVSVVTKPANKQPFLFWKSGDKEKLQPLEKLEKPMEIVIKSDGTEKGTKIIVNGKKLKDPDAFNFSFQKHQPGDSADYPVVYCSYNKIEEQADGFKRNITHWLTKNEGDNLMLDKFEKMIQTLSGDEKYALVRKAGELSEDAQEAVNKALEIIGTYSESITDDLEKSIIVLMEYAASAMPVEKQDEDTAKEDTEKSEAEEKPAEEKVEKEEKAEKIDDTLAKSIEEILTSVKEVKEKVEKSQEVMEDLGTRLETVEKSTDARNSIKGQDSLNKEGVASPSLASL